MARGHGQRSWLEVMVRCYGQRSRSGNITVSVPGRRSQTEVNMIRDYGCKSWSRASSQFYLRIGNDEIGNDGAHQPMNVKDTFNPCALVVQSFPRAFMLIAL